MKNTKPLWAIQKFAINDEDSKDLVNIITRLGLPHEKVNVAPFDYLNIPDVVYDGPIIPYGGTNFINTIRKTKNWMCWFNDNFQYKLALANYGKHMFNSDARCMKMKEFNPSQYKKGEYLFIRPNLDLKEFAGNTICPEDFAGWYRQIQGKGFEVNEEMDIVVAQASKINDEWRVFIVDSKPVSASRYRSDHRPSIDLKVPPSVFEFAEKMISIWKPADVFVMDVCSLHDELFVLEVGDFHSAGWYHTDKEKIIDLISKSAERLWLKNTIEQ